MMQTTLQLLEVVIQLWLIQVQYSIANAPSNNITTSSLLLGYMEQVVVIQSN
jgi:hypothetical protein